MHGQYNELKSVMVADDDQKEMDFLDYIIQSRKHWAKKSDFVQEILTRLKTNVEGIFSNLVEIVF